MENAKMLTTTPEVANLLTPSIRFSMLWTILFDSEEERAISLILARSLSTSAILFVNSSCSFS